MDEDHRVTADNRETVTYPVFAMIDLLLIWIVDLDLDIDRPLGAGSAESLGYLIFIKFSQMLNWLHGIDWMESGLVGAR